LPSNVARAVAPFGAAMIWRFAGGYDAVLWAVLAGAVLAAAGFWLASASSWHRHGATHNSLS
jgi:hypothetical protein